MSILTNVEGLLEESMEDMIDGSCLDAHLTVRILKVLRNLNEKGETVIALRYDLLVDQV